MAAETAEDLAALFHPDDFGVELIAHMPDESVTFTGILTTAQVFDQPGTVAQVSMMVPRIITRKASVPLLAQNDQIELPGGQQVIVNDVAYKGELMIIHYHEAW
jgi:hypothetical protein